MRVMQFPHPKDPTWLANRAAVLARDTVCTSCRSKPSTRVALRRANVTDPAIDLVGWEAQWTPDNLRGVCGKECSWREEGTWQRLRTAPPTTRRKTSKKHIALREPSLNIKRINPKHVEMYMDEEHGFS